MTSALRSISIELHDVIALGIGTRHRVSSFLRFWNFQHASTHIALNLDGFRTGWFWSVAQGAANIGGPTERIGVSVFSFVQL